MQVFEEEINRFINLEEYQDVCEAFSRLDQVELLIFSSVD